MGQTFLSATGVSTFAGPVEAPLSPLRRGTPRFFAAGGLEFTAEDPLWSPLLKGDKGEQPDWKVRRTGRLESLPLKFGHFQGQLRVRFWQWQGFGDRINVK